MAEDLKLEIEALRKEVAELRTMVTSLQATPAAAPAAAPAAPKKAEITEEVLTIISAAVAAFLGKRATIRIIRPVASPMNSWQVQGRATIHGSHAVNSR